MISCDFLSASVRGELSSLFSIEVFIMDFAKNENIRFFQIEKEAIFWLAS